MNLTRKIDSSLSHKNIYSCLKLPIPFIRGECFRIISQNSEYVKSVCIRRNNSFHFACRKWIINQYFEKNVFSYLICNEINSFKYSVYQFLNIKYFLSSNVIFTEFCVSFTEQKVQVQFYVSIFVELYTHFHATMLRPITVFRW